MQDVSTTGQAVSFFEHHISRCGQAVSFAGHTVST